MALTCSTMVQSFEHQRILSSPPVNDGESRPRHFRPCDILLIPKVAQTEPRITRPNQRLKETMKLTSELKLKKVKDAQEVKQLKKQKQEIVAREKAIVCAILLIIVYIHIVVI